MTRILCLLIALCALSACESDRPPPTGAYLAGMPKAMRAQEMPARFKYFYDAGDLDGLMTLFEPDAVLRSGDGATVVRGYAAIREALEHAMAAGAVIETVQSEVLEAGDLAYVQSRWKISGTLQRAGRAREILRRQPDGRWLYAIDMPTADIASATATGSASPAPGTPGTPSRR